MPCLTCGWPPHDKRCHIDYTPFGTFEVLDNRSDTSHVFIDESFPRPPVDIGFDTTASVAIRRYLEVTAGQIKNGSETLLLRIQTLNLPNNGYQLYRGAHSSTVFARYRRNDLICEAQAYYRTENRYRKLFDATVQRYQVPTTEVSIWVADILNELLESASVVHARDHGQGIRHHRYLSSLLRNPLCYRYPDREKLFSIAEINQNMRLQWPKYPVLKATNVGSGKYLVFEDFRAGITDYTPMQIRFDAVDSVYRVRFLNKDSTGVGDYWGISDGCYAYLKIGPNAFLKLVRQDSTFVFYVPHTMPDFYARFSPATGGYAEPQQADIGSLTPNILVDLATILVVGAINEATRRHAEKQAAARRTQIVPAPEDFGYRYGWLEMNTGDILYKKP
jgi:hypothetical protein